MRRRRDPRVVVLVVAAFAVLSGVVVGMAARWPTAGVVVSFVLVSSAAVVAADDPALRRRLRRAVAAVHDRLRGGTGDRADVPAGVSAENRLLRAGVLTDGGDGLPDVASDFERAWRRRIVSMGDRSEDEAFLADLLADRREAVRLDWEATEGALVATVDGARAGRWPSRAAFVADVTAVATFREEYPGWWTLSPAERTRALAALRLCLDWCPTCDGPISVDRADRRDGPGSVLAATCGGCDARLFEAELEGGTFDRPRARDAEA